MILDQYSVYDGKALSYLNPLLTQNDDTAIRIFSEALMTEEHTFCQHAEDYTLFHCGVWDDKEGEVTKNPEGPRLIAKGWEVKAGLEARNRQYKILDGELESHRADVLRAESMVNGVVGQQPITLKTAIAATKGGE